MLRMQEDENKGFFACNLAYLLAGNCRAKAKGVIRRIGSHIKPFAATEDKPDKLSLMDSTSKFSDWEGELRTEGLRPIHVVTSEPTLHISSPGNAEKSSFSDPEQDSDVYYDFDLVSPDTYHSFNGSSINVQCNIEDIGYNKLEENEVQTGERAESGCVTCSASPTVFEEEQENSSKFSPYDKRRIFIKRASDINLDEVKCILLSSHQLPYKSFSDNDFRARNYFSDYPCFPEIVYNNKQNHQLNPRVKLETFRRSELATENKNKRENIRKTYKKNKKRKLIKKQRRKEYNSSSSSSIDSETSSYCLYIDRGSSSNSSSESLPLIHSPNVSHNKNAQYKQQLSNSSQNEKPTTHESPTYDKQHSSSLINICENKLENIQINSNINSTNDKCISKSDSGIVSKPCSYYYDPVSQQYYKTSDVRDAFVDSCRKMSFEQQKARHIEKFYKSLVRKIPTKNLKYVNIELSDEKEAAHEICNSDKCTRKPRESQVSAFDNASQVSDERVTCKESSELLKPTDKKSTSSPISAVYKSEGEGWSCFRDSNYGNLYEEVGYLSLHDDISPGILTRSEVPLNVMYNSEGQTKVKKNIPKCDDSDECKDDYSFIKKSSKNNECLVNSHSETQNKISHNISLQNGISPVKQEQLKNGKHPSEKMFLKRPSSSVNGDKTDSSNKKDSNNFVGTNTTAASNSSSENNLVQSDVNGDSKLKFNSHNIELNPCRSDTTSIVSVVESENCADTNLVYASEKIGSKSYFSSSSMHNSSGCDSVNDEIQTLSENDIIQLNDSSLADEEEDDDDIILSGKFQNILQYSERVSSLSDEDDKEFPTEVIYIDEAEQEDEEEEEESQESEVDNEQLASELEKLKTKENALLQSPTLDVEPPSDESARSSCERDPEDFKQRIKRSSSLKCGKTPPGTPGQKKIVRFADVLGLDLADVRTFLEGVPNVPKEAYCDLNVEEEASHSSSSHQHSSVAMAVSQRILTAMFQQPGCLPNFLDKVRCQKVSLENITVESDLSVKGIIRVYNLDFHKSVYVRYTFDHWKNFHETHATYLKDSSDGLTDRFSFLLWGSFLQTNGALIFCIRYCCKGEEFWDNNRGANYVLQCYPSDPNENKSLTGRPQNDSNVQNLPVDKKHHRSFLETPTTPDDPWMPRFF